MEVDAYGDMLCIDPSLLEEGQAQEQIEHTGAWLDPPNIAALGLGSIELEDTDEGVELPAWVLDLPTLQDLEGNCGTSQQLQETQADVASSSPTLVRSALRPEAQAFVPQGSARPRLQLSTPLSYPVLVVPATAQAAPLSAPAIRVYEPDDALASAQQTTGVGQMSRQTTRRRAYSSPRTMLGQTQRAATAPDPPAKSAGSHHRQVAQWMDSSSYPRMLAQVPSSPVSPIHLASAPTTPSRSRSSSVASSARSSGSGSHTCDHGACSQSSKRYKTRSALNHHKRCHLPYELRTYVCHVCQKRFIFNKELTRHSLTHLEYQFHCATCSRSFARSDHLTRHMSIHGGPEGVGTPNSASVAESTPGAGLSSIGHSLPDTMTYDDPVFSTPLTTYSSRDEYGSASLSACLSQEVDPMEVDLDRDSLIRLAQSVPPSPSPAPRGRSSVR